MVKSHKHTAQLPNQEALQLLNSADSQHLHPDQLVSIFTSMGAPLAAQNMNTNTSLRKKLGVQSTEDGRPVSSTGFSAVSYKLLFVQFENACQEAITSNPGVLFPGGLSTLSAQDIENLYLRAMSRRPSAEDLSQVQSVISGSSNQALALCVYVYAGLEALSQ